MELRQLKYFMSAATHLNFTLAAKECFVAQTTMSQQIKELEKDLGVHLFQRKNNALSLTQEGRQLQKDAEKILHNVEVAEKNLLSLQKNGATTTKLGFYGDGLGVHFPKIVDLLNEKHPDIRIEFHECHGEDILDALEFDVIDCAVNIMNAETQEPEWLAKALICKSPMEISAAPGVFSFPDGSLLDPDEQLPLPLVTLSSTVVQQLRKFNSGGAQHFSKISNPYSSLREIYLSVACKQIIALSPEYARSDMYSLNHFKFKNITLDLPIYLMWKKKKSCVQIEQILDEARIYFKTLG